MSSYFYSNCIIVDISDACRLSGQASNELLPLETRLSKESRARKQKSIDLSSSLDLSWLDSWTSLGSLPSVEQFSFSKELADSPSLNPNMMCSDKKDRPDQHGPSQVPDCNYGSQSAEQVQALNAEQRSSMTFVMDKNLNFYPNGCIGVPNVKYWDMGNQGMGQNEACHPGCFSFGCSPHSQVGSCSTDAINMWSREQQLMRALTETNVNTRREALSSHDDLCSVLDPQCPKKPVLYLNPVNPVKLAPTTTKPVDAE